MTRLGEQSEVAPGVRRLGWLWFVAWLLVGAGYALAVLGALTIGPFVLPLPVLATIALTVYRPARVGAPGLISGASLPIFFVAFLNRGGPGSVCDSTATGQSCTDEWSPWPFVVVGVAVLAIGVVTMVMNARIVGRTTPSASDLPR